MSLATRVNRFQWFYTTNPGSGGPGVTPGVSNAEGSWTQIASAANIAEEVWAFGIWLNSGALAGTSKRHFLDIGVDTAGGSAYTAVISNINMGGSSANANGGLWFYFPLRIPAGSTVAARIQGSHSTAGSVGVRPIFFGKPSAPEMVRAASYSETLGAGASTTGTAVTPGNSSAEGTWTSIGTLTDSAWYWQLGAHIDNATTTSKFYHVDLGYGDGTTIKPIITDWYYAAIGTSEFYVSGPQWNCECEVPAGATIYARATCNTTTDTGFNVTVIALGG